MNLDLTKLDDKKQNNYYSCTDCKIPITVKAIKYKDPYINYLEFEVRTTKVYVECLHCKRCGYKENEKIQELSREEFDQQINNCIEQNMETQVLNTGFYGWGPAGKSK